MEIFTAYTKEDPNSKIAVSTRRLAFTGLERDVLAYVYRDKGVDFFNGNFIHLITLKLTASSTNEVVNPWVMSNDIDGVRDLFKADNTFDALRVQLTYSGGTLTLRVAEVVGGTNYGGSSYNITLGTIYYLKIVRDESEGYGTLYCYIYSDAGRTTHLSTLSLTLHANNNFRYIFPLLSYEVDPSGHTATGYIENLELITMQLDVTTQPVTDITDTTATGNGIIVDLGLSTVTAHGHCWAIKIDPTLSDTSVDNGEGSLGAYTTSMQNLLAGQQYYVRSFVTSTEGTVFGANVVFTATSDTTSVQLIRGNIGIVQERIHIISASGKEIAFRGQEV